MRYGKESLVVLVAFIFYQLLSSGIQRYSAKQPVFAGTFHPLFRPVAETFRQNIQSGFDKGSALAIYHNGEPVVDLWGGWADVEAERPWQEDTVALTWSVAKSVAAITLARLVDMGVLDYKEKVKFYWPKFVHSNVTVEMLLSHQAGLTQLERTITLLDVRDNWKEIESLLATATPVWPPGTAVGYHATTFGLYADVLVRKVDPKQRNMTTFFNEEIAKPLGIEVSIGLPRDWTFRLARQHFISLWSEWSYWPVLLRFITNPYFYKCLFAFDYSSKLSILNNVDLLTVGLPSTTGFASARGLAKLFGFLANNGSVKGQTLLSPEAVSALAEPLTMNKPNLFAASYPFSRGTIIYSNEGRGVFGHTGLGGSIAYADANTGLGVAYLSNHINVLAVRHPSFMAIQESLEIAFRQYQEKLQASKATPS